MGNEDTPVPGNAAQCWELNKVHLHSTVKRNLLRSCRDAFVAFLGLKALEHTILQAAFKPVMGFCPAGLCQLWDACCCPSQGSQTGCSLEPRSLTPDLWSLGDSRSSPASCQRSSWLLEWKSSCSLLPYKRAGCFAYTPESRNAFA